MKKVLAVAAAALLLAGCTAAPSDDEYTARLVPDAAASAEPYETTGPPEPVLTDAEVLYLEWVNSETVERLTPGKTDEEMLAAGWAACDQFAQGIEWTDIDVIDADPSIDVNDRLDYEISGMASQSLCTEHNVTVID